MVRKRKRGSVKSEEEIKAFVDAGSDQGEATFDVAEGQTNQYKLMAVKPENCKPWALHDRTQLWFVSEDADRLKQSIEKNGQLEPGTVRAVGEGSYEVIVGARRWNACRSLGVDFFANVLPKETPDSVCAVLMDTENSTSEKLTEFEKALSYSRLLKHKVFDSQAAMAEEYGVRRQYIQKLVAAAKVMDEPGLRGLLEKCVLNLSIKNAILLAGAAKDEGKAELLKKKAASLKKEGESNPLKILKALLGATLIKKTETPLVVNTSDGKAFAKAKKGRDSTLTITVNTKVGGKEEREKLISSVVDLIRKEMD